MDTSHFYILPREINIYVVCNNVVCHYGVMTVIYNVVCDHQVTHVLIQGVGMDVIRVPLHQIHLQSELVSGPVVVGARPSLPVKVVSYPGKITWQETN